MPNVEFDRCRSAPYETGEFADGWIVEQVANIDFAWVFFIHGKNDFSKCKRTDDNLFEVGVSSLTLTEIVLAVEEKHPGKVDISDLFDYPTIRELADFIRR